MFSFSGVAQEVIHATTTTGDRVVLKPDQTWYYADKGEKNTEEAKSLPTNSSTTGNTPKPSTTTSTAKRSSSSRSYTRGPRGGCYYISASGKKVYVDRSLCN